MVSFDADKKNLHLLMLETGEAPVETVRSKKMSDLFVVQTTCQITGNVELRDYYPSCLRLV